MSVFRHTWTDVSGEDVDNYKRKNDLKYLKDPKVKGAIIAVSKNDYRDMVFRYVPDDYTLYSDYTLIDLDMGRAKKKSIVEATVEVLDNNHGLV